ncbi:MAG: YraN family protein, partial [Eubacterium sp.]|nr:YraN family protein [Eubacterium sp.]
MNSLGKLAEIKASEYLQKKHYRLIDANYSSRFGEIDLIMQKGKYLCFIEVK